MRYCCEVEGCRSQKTNEKLSFFTLPRDEGRRKKWLDAMGRPDLLNKKLSCHFICSLHFDKTLIKFKPQLQADALPTKLLPNQSGSSSSGTDEEYIDVATQTEETLCVQTKQGSKKTVGFVKTEKSAGAEQKAQNDIKAFCPKCNSEVSHIAEAIQLDQTKIIVAKVYHYLEQEYEDLKKTITGIDQTPLAMFRQRTALATGVSEATVDEILQEEARRNEEMRQQALSQKRLARKRPKQSDSSGSSDITDDDKQTKTVVVKVEPVDQNIEEPEVYVELPSVKVEPGESGENTEPADPIAIEMKIEPRDEEATTSKETTTVQSDTKSLKKRKTKRSTDAPPAASTPPVTAAPPATSAPPGGQFKTPRKNTVLNRQAREMIYHVHNFMKKEAEDGVKNIKQVQKRTAEATNISVATVRRILKESCGGQLLSVFKTPGKKRPRAKPITGIDNFDQGVIKRCIHNFHITEKELPTIEKLRRKLQSDINFQGSERSLRRIVQNLGFKSKRTENHRQILLETSNIRFMRIEYLKRISQYRQERRPIVYTDETYVDSSLTPTAWPDESMPKKKPIPNKQRVVIIHAGSEAGFIPNALLTFKADVKTGDNHDNMNWENYEKWLRTQLIPNLPNNSVVVLDNATYHNQLCDPAPTSNARKSVMTAWLTDRSISFDENWLKPQLYNLIKCHKEKYESFYIDKMLAANNHDVLRLPPCHPDLNPIEMAWTAIKGYVCSKNLTWSVEGVSDLVKEKVSLMGASDWGNWCQKVKNIEDDYKKSDNVVDILTEEFVIRVDSDDSDTANSDESDNFTDEDDEPTGASYIDDDDFM